MYPVFLRKRGKKTELENLCSERKKRNVLCLYSISSTISLYARPCNGVPDFICLRFT